MRTTTTEVRLETPVHRVLKVAVRVALGFLLACSHASSSAPLPTCKNPGAPEVACDACGAASCGDEVAAIESACGAYLTCLAACDCSDSACQRTCEGQSSTSCMIALGQKTCAACTSACTTTATGSGTGSPVNCFAVEGDASARTCTPFQSNAASSCPSGYSSGSCPSAGLVGCCVTTMSSAGTNLIGGECFYDAASAASAKPACIPPGEAWQTSPP